MVIMSDQEYARFISNIKMEAYEEGYRDGRDETLDEIWSVKDKSRRRSEEVIIRGLLTNAIL